MLTFAYTMSLQEKDKQYIWHPFTQMQTAQNILPVIKAEGVYFYTEDGKKIIDAVSSWWTNVHGHGHPHIAKALTDLLKTDNSIDRTYPLNLQNTQKTINVSDCNFGSYIMILVCDGVNEDSKIVIIQ